MLLGTLVRQTTLSVTFGKRRRSIPRRGAPTVHDAPSTAPSGRGASGGADVVVISDDETDGGDSQRGGDSRRGGDGKAWPCAVCTFLNAASKVSCEVCTAARQ